MRLATIRLDGRRTAAARVEGDDLVVLDHPDVGTLLRVDPSLDSGRRGEGERRAAETADYAPLVPHPNKVVCLGLNYATHIAEMGRDVPDYPTLFAKFDGALIGAHDPILLPRVSESVDWEAELAIVIGRSARHVDKGRALEHVAGYSVLNDVTVRDWQHRTREFLSGKTFESTTPLGPHLVTADELPAGAAGLSIECSVDGEVMQRSDTGDLLFDVSDIVSYVSTIITLQPGDVIATGTPGGVGAGRTPPVYLRAGQVLATTIEGIGTLRNVCRPEAGAQQ